MLLPGPLFVYLLHIQLFWNSRHFCFGIRAATETAFESPESLAYYTGELRQALRFLANHPSFVMLTLGNELASGELGHRRMEDLLSMAHAMDATRLFACGSNTHYGWYGYQGGSDFYTSFHLREQDLRATYDNMKGYLNHRYPNAKNDYEAAMTVLRKDCGKPVFSFEVGQFEVLPDFGEIADFRGVTRAVNYELIRKKVEQSGAMDTWTKQVEATGELSNLCYREEVEAALRTERYSGISLLGIQDFPGQGTALVGMLNAHLQPKPYPLRSRSASGHFSGMCCPWRCWRSTPMKTQRPWWRR